MVQHQNLDSDQEQETKYIFKILMIIRLIFFQFPLFVLVQVAYNIYIGEVSKLVDNFTLMSWKLFPVFGSTSSTVPIITPSGKMEEKELVTMVSPRLIFTCFAISVNIPCVASCPSQTMEPMYPLF